MNFRKGRKKQKSDSPSIGKWLKYLKEKIYGNKNIGAKDL